MRITKRVIKIGESLGIILDKIITNGKIVAGDEVEVEIIKIKKPINPK